MARAEDLTGQKFGKLTVLEKTDQRKNKYVVWRCRCECGKEVQASSKELKKGSVWNCGCVPRKNARKGRVAEDLTGQRFGRLVALYPTEKRDSKGSVYWHCKCDCGNAADVSEAELRHGNYRSCGCLKAENQKKIADKLHRIDGTCVEILEKRKYRKDNSSGFRGVYRLKNGRYRVDIGFRRKRFYLGTYGTFEEAVNVRLNVEHQFHDGFVKAYYEWKEKAETDPAWAEQNPFRYEAGTYVSNDLK